ncbi:hypothetical protein XspCFBP7912_03875 [Xanthomonas sp. CFBP 7912]|nr:hypothetical protein XspCFBP7912_03875 [Xanthomonas sp. CFBP 7912]RJS05175.1 hypothetical protein XnspCFBP7698_02765 [Xanthomonas sp. CFBP 7698]
MEISDFFGISVAKVPNEERSDFDFKVAKGVLKDLNFGKFKIGKPAKVVSYGGFKRFFIFQWGDKCIGRIISDITAIRREP